MVVAEDARQARAIMRFIRGLLHGAPMLKRTIVGETAESFTLKNRVQIEVHAASFRSTSGYTTVAALLDEISIWPCDELSAEPDVEVINSIRPGMATIPDAVLLCAELTACSTRSTLGCLPSALRPRRRCPGLAGHHRDMNTTVPQSWIDTQLAKTQPAPAADYMAQFRNDLEGFICRDAVMQCVVPGLRERPPDRPCPPSRICRSEWWLNRFASRSASATTTSPAAP